VTPIVLLILVGMWAAVLLPPYLRDRNDNKAAGAQSPVSNKLNSLSRSFGHRDRSGYLPVTSSSLGSPQQAGSPLPAGSRHPLTLAPSTATDFRHGFSWMAKYFPEGRTLTSQIEERLWDELVGVGREASPVIFEDQYLSTAGAFYELLAGHDRMVGDLRPLVYARLDLEFSLVCHPYDVCIALLLEEAGVLYEHPLGGFPDAPLDTTSGIAWVAYANPFLAAQARPILQKVLRQFLA